MLNEKQKVFFDKAMEGKNLFITGAAGVGKTYLVNEIIKAKKNRIIICASTGVAARAIGGYTIHHQFHIDVKTDKIEDKQMEKNKWIEKTDLIVIDEVSMLSFHIFNQVGKAIKKFNDKCQVIVIGDFFQLPPVITKSTEMILRKRGYHVEPERCHCFHSKYWKEFNFETCILTQAMRQEDQDFSTALYDLSRGSLTQEERFYLKKAQDNDFVSGDDSIILSCVNKTANSINDEKLSMIKSKLYTFKADYWGLYDKYAAPLELKIKVGAKVMLLTNNMKAGYCNGDLGFVTFIDDDVITVKLNNGNEIEVERFDFGSYIFEDGKTKLVGSIRQFPIGLAWAITVHKSQGQTYEKVNFYFDNGFFEGAKENLTLLYVGMSRAKTIENLHLRIKIGLPQFTNQDVLNFYLGNYETYKSDYDRTFSGVGF